MFYHKIRSVGGVVNLPRTSSTEEAQANLTKALRVLRKDRDVAANYHHVKYNHHFVSQGERERLKDEASHRRAQIRNAYDMLENGQMSREEFEEKYGFEPRAV